MIGSTVDTWTRATMSAEGASDVINHVAPTVWIRLPKFDRRLAIHRARKMRERNGERAEVAGARCGSSVLGCANLGSDIQPLLPAAEARPDLGRGDVREGARRPLLNAEARQAVQWIVLWRGRGTLSVHKKATEKRQLSTAGALVWLPVRSCLCRLGLCSPEHLCGTAHQPGRMGWAMKRFEDVLSSTPNKP